jgi:hypothetical protein
VGTDGDKSIPVIHGSTKIGIYVKDGSNGSGSNVDDGIAAVNVTAADHSSLSSGGKQSMPSVITTPNRTRTNSSSGTALAELSGHEVAMPSLPLHVLKPAFSSNDSLPDSASEPSRRNIDSPAPVGGSPTTHGQHNGTKSTAHITLTHIVNPALVTPLTTSSGKTADRVSGPKALEKIDLSGVHQQPNSGRQGHQRSGSGSTLAAGAVGPVGSARLSALTHSPITTSLKSRPSSGSASTMMAVHHIQSSTSLVAERQQERQYLAALEVTHKPAGSATAEESIDRIVQERLLEAKAMDRKSSSGAVMHQFSLWSKVAPAPAPTAPTAALRTHSDGIAHPHLAPVGAHNPFGVAHPAGSGEDVAQSPKSSHKKLAALTPSPSTVPVMASAAAPGATDKAEGGGGAQPVRRASKLRGPKAAREAHSTLRADDEAADSPLAGTSAGNSGRNARSRASSREPLDDEYTLEFEPFTAFGGTDDHEKHAAPADGFHSSGNSSLALALRKKVGGAKLVNSSVDSAVEAPERGVPEGKHAEAASHVYKTPDKKQSPAVSTSNGAAAPSAAQQELEDSDGGWYSDEFAEEDEEDEAGRLSTSGNGRPRSAEARGLSEEAAAVKSMSKSGPAAFATHKMSSSLNGPQGLLETSSDKVNGGFLTERTGMQPPRRATMGHHAVGRLDAAISAGASEGVDANGQPLKSMTSRSASECHISFDPRAARSSTKGGSSSKYQTLKSLKSSKSAAQYSTSEKITAHEFQSRSAKVGGVEAAALGSSERLPVTKTPEQPVQPSDSEIMSARSANSRDDAGSPTLSEASDIDDPHTAAGATAPTGRSPLRLDLDKDPRDLAAGLTSGAGDRTHEESPLRWRKGEVIGEGTFGKVYKGMNEKTGELLAIKQLCLIDGTSGEVDSLRKEISVMWNLEHENIVRYAQCLVAALLPTLLTLSFISTQVSGYLQDRAVPLHYIRVCDRRIHSRYDQSVWGVQREAYQVGALRHTSYIAVVNVTASFATRRFSQHIVAGVDYLHSKGIIHRDIKGANILVSGAGVAKLADFGCSKQLAGMCTASIEESLKAIRGSVPWMAPEVIKQSGHGRSSDIWSVGATVIEMGKLNALCFSSCCGLMHHTIRLLSYGQAAVARVYE